MGRVVLDKGLLLAILALLVSLGAVVFAHQSNRIANEANRIATKSYEVTYQSNLPIITATYSCDAPFDIPQVRSTEVIEVENQGGPLTDYWGHIYEWWQVICLNCDSPCEYIPLQGYWDIPKYTGNCQGLVETWVSMEGAHTLSQRIQSDFKQAAA